MLTISLLWMQKNKCAKHTYHYEYLCILLLPLPTNPDSFKSWDLHNNMLFNSDSLNPAVVAADAENKDNYDGFNV